MITECRDASLKEHNQPNVAGTLNLHLSWVVKCCAKCCALKAFNEKEAVLFFMILNRKQSKLKYHMLSKNHTLKSYQGLYLVFIRLLMFLLLMLANNVPTHSPSSMGIRYASELGALWATNITARPQRYSAISSLLFNASNVALQHIRMLPSELTVVHLNEMHSFVGEQSTCIRFVLALQFSRNVQA